MIQTADLIVDMLGTRRIMGEHGFFKSPFQIWSKTPKTQVRPKDRIIGWTVLLIIAMAIFFLLADQFGILPTESITILLLRWISGTILALLNIGMMSLIFFKYYQRLSRCRKIVESNLSFGFITYHDDTLYLKDPTGKILPTKSAKLHLSRLIIFIPRFIFHDLMSHMTTNSLFSIPFLIMILTAFIAWLTHGQPEETAMVPLFIYLFLFTSLIITMLRLSRTQKQLKDFVRKGLCPNCSYNVINGQPNHSVKIPPNSICSECGSRLPFIMDASFVEQAQPHSTVVPAP